MLDLHQGITGEELKDVKPGLGSIALAQLDTFSTLAKGDWKGALKKQFGTWVLVGRTVVDKATSILRR